MRVLMLISSLHAGGAERVTIDLASYLASRGHEVHLMIARRSNRTPEVYLLPRGVSCHWARWGVENKVSRQVANYLLLKKLLHKLDPDWIMSLGAQYRLMSISGVFDSYKVLLSERNYPPKRYLGGELGFIKEVYGRATKVVFQTEEIAECFPDLPHDKVRVIPNAIRFGNVRWKGCDSKKVAFVGRLVEQKNPEMLLRAFSLFHAEHPDYRLHIYGDGPLGEKMKELSRALGTGETVVFHGQVTGVDEELSTSHMYVSTSNFEGISNSMLEALAMGVPAVCTDCAGGGARLAIDDGVNGLLVPCGDARALAAAMDRIAGSTELADSLSAHAVESSRRFSEDRIYPLWEEALG